jgi:hypothetical protein
VCEFEDDARAAKIMEGIPAFRIYQRRAIRADAARFVVVEHDDIDSSSAESLDFGHRIRAAIHRDQKARGVLRHAAFEARLAKAVALLHAVGEKAGWFRAVGAEEPCEDRQRGDAVHIVVSVNDDAFVSTECGREPVDCRWHFREKFRRGEGAESWVHVGLGIRRMIEAIPGSVV